MSLVIANNLLGLFTFIFSFANNPDHVSDLVMWSAFYQYLKKKKKSQFLTI